VCKAWKDIKNIESKVFVKKEFSSNQGCVI